MSPEHDPPPQHTLPAAGLEQEVPWSSPRREHPPSCLEHPPSSLEEALVHLSVSVPQWSEQLLC